MFCKKCGTELEEGSIFCGKCGSPQNFPVSPENDIAPKTASLPNNKLETREEADSDETNYLRMILGFLGLYWVWSEQDQTLSFIDKGIKIAANFCIILGLMVSIYGLDYVFTIIQGDIWGSASDSNEKENSWLAIALKSPLLFIHKMSLLIIGVSFAYVFQWAKNGGLNLADVVFSFVLYTFILFGSLFAIIIITKVAGIANKDERKRKQIASVLALLCTAIICWVQFR